MVEVSGVPQADIQRPLDESTPGAGPALLRPAIPASTTGYTGIRAPARHARPTLLTRAARALRPVPRRTLTAVSGWSRQPAGRFAVPGAVITALVGSAVAAGAFVVPAAGAMDQQPSATTGATSPATGATGATGTPAPTAPPTLAPPLDPAANPTDAAEPVGPPADILRDWAQQMSIRTGVPVVALQAYGYAELVVAETTPGCQLSWTTLAAIGRVESNHGSANGASLGADGQASPSIRGDALDGRGGRMHIPDTDSGRLDGDRVYDRAVGPMQFIPDTWRTEAIDATGDGVADINNIHDAALAAANYLCRGGRDLTTATDWWAAILSYNNVRSYADEIFAAANDYGRQSRT